MKLLIIFAVVILAALVSGESSQKHNVVWGVAGEGDVRLTRSFVKMGSKFLRKVQKVLEYSGKDGYVITSVRCYDQSTDGEGGYATLLRGGPGFKSVEINFKSQRGHGLNFVVDIIGKKSDGKNDVPAGPVLNDIGDIPEPMDD